MFDVNTKIFSHLENGARIGRPLSALQGGRRAGKTFTICQWLLVRMWNDGDDVVFASMTAEQGRRGAFKDCETILNDWEGYRDYFTITKQPREIKCNNGRGGIAYFSSFQDPETAKGAACDWVFINEANKFSKQQYLDLAANARKGVIVDYNPNVRFWIDEVIPSGYSPLVVTWRDNIDHLSPVQLQWFEQLKRDAEKPDATSADWYYYQVYYLGQYSDLSGNIFTRRNTDIRTREEIPLSELRNFCVFGDPSALRKNDFFALVLSAVDSKGDVWVLDVFSVNDGERSKVFDEVRRMCGEWDGVRVYFETFGEVGQQAYIAAVNDGLTVYPFNLGRNKFERIVAKYHDWTHRLHFVDNYKLENYLSQCYAFSEKCEHDDNIDAVISSIYLQDFLKG